MSSGDVKTERSKILGQRGSVKSLLKEAEMQQEKVGEKETGVETVGGENCRINKARLRHRKQICKD